MLTFDNYMYVVASGVIIRSPARDRNVDSSYCFVFVTAEPRHSVTILSHAISCVQCAAAAVL